MSRIRWMFALVIVLLLAACDAPDPALEQEISALRDDVSDLRQQLDDHVSTEDPGTTTTTSLVPDASTTTSTIPASSTTTSVGEEPVAFPAERQDLVHGGDTWVVVLAASEGTNDPDLMSAVIAATEAGYTTGPTDCDSGAAEALDLPADRQFYTVSVYLSSEADAIAARDAFAARGIGGVVAMVQTFCLD